VGVAALEAPVRTNRAAGLDWWDNHGWPPVPLPILMVMALVAICAIAVARVDYAVTYQPLRFGNGAYGPVSGFEAVDDGFATTRWLLVAKAGATGTFEYGVYNDGDDPVTIYDVPQPTDDVVYTSMAWATMQDRDDVHKLPVVVPPHKTVELLFSVRKPPCPGNGVGMTIDSLVVHYRAFGVSHAVDLPLSGFSVAPIEVCWSRH